MEEALLALMDMWARAPRRARQAVAAIALAGALLLAFHVESTAPSGWYY